VARKGQTPGRRCDLGCASWPDSDEYDICPYCDQETTRYTNLTPMDPEEASKAKSHVLFEDFYEEWCLKKGQKVAGPLEERSFEDEVASLLADADL
jgi:hypothetical protein